MKPREGVRRAEQGPRLYTCVVLVVRRRCTVRSCGGRMRGRVDDREVHLTEDPLVSTNWDMRCVGLLPPIVERSFTSALPQSHLGRVSKE